MGAQKGMGLELIRPKPKTLNSRGLAFTYKYSSGRVGLLLRTFGLLRLHSGFRGYVGEYYIIGAI